MYVRKVGQSMSYQDVGVVHFIQKRAGLIGTRYAFLESSADHIPFPTMLLESSGLSAYYDRTSLQAFIVRVCSTFPGEEALKVAWTRTL